MHTAYAREKTELEATHADKIVLLEANFDKYKQDLQVFHSKARAELEESVKLLVKENTALKKQMEKVKKEALESSTQKQE